ncbi:DNA polymerase III subunit beta [candidate division WOR-1 bacterium RIFOXYA12_FULL_52_29]|uniref:Beta sliding clamp n=1 Tax=candidate division WOR-1 bacterium RIFOXYC12_FULL_54_18 TaxID=1802584 RepID=A0A1F4T791_UNCSA|nr:MAG: DNA polymerase III subunit beta [candidate division WOR-1 bacterium RIFOXYA2_FULL_51_19]OGC18010.1 MAG: DNA polymerase III subunit beta [candidate division WOR-1 bacterium RIFOXYA12_FULL_52_29]OGC26866.1 MAG: DNA polymerase III subunit beta [candidate division WOR-1 bacterium RIFOXYB2_FULL_45_9]OGC28427.1 MAG: DNA polymerase III subunit beta [candidate division WOR-1 bacterium RIFOXYC12_FULL_54_18]OGC31118.1 MAG: DNA polymerase III subunit beta [candidate division WOR-1 bacterium RIFOXY
MEFSCEKKELQSGVSTVEKIVATRSTLPIIGNILFELSKTGLKLSANNLEMGIELFVKANVSKEGSFLLPAKTLSGIVSKLPDTSINFKVGENKTVKISYESSHFNLHSLPADEFPSLPKVKDGKTITVDAKVFASMIKHTIFSVSSSEDKYVLTGILVEFGKSGISGDNSNMRLVATDGYRLAKRGEKVVGGAEGVSIIVPARAMNELIKILDLKNCDTVKITVSNDQVSFNCGDVYLVSRVIQGKFPDYKQVVPKKCSTKVKINRKELLSAAERGAVIASGSANVTMFEVKGSKLHLSAHTPDVGSFDEGLEAEIEGSEKVRVSFNVRLISDVLESLASENVMLEFSEGLSPGVIRPADQTDYLYIVMPIRTQEAA